jgi:hypothetical protein
MSAILGRPVTITAAEPGTGGIITIRADGDRARWQPRTAGVFAGWAGDACRPSADRACGYINFFTTARAARAWARRHPEITGRLPPGKALVIRRGLGRARPGEMGAAGWDVHVRASGPALALATAQQMSGFAVLRSRLPVAWRMEAAVALPDGLGRYCAGVRLR